jgi:hypothetical protein
MARSSTTAILAAHAGSSAGLQSATDQANKVNADLDQINADLNPELDAFRTARSSCRGTA